MCVSSGIKIVTSTIGRDNIGLGIIPFCFQFVVCRVRVRSIEITFVNRGWPIMGMVKVACDRFCSAVSLLVLDRRRLAFEGEVSNRKRPRTGKACDKREGLRFEDVRCSLAAGK